MAQYVAKYNVRTSLFVAIRDEYRFEADNDENAIKIADKKAQEIFTRRVLHVGLLSLVEERPVDLEEYHKRPKTSPQAETSSQS